MFPFSDSRDTQARHEMLHDNLKVQNNVRLAFRFDMTSVTILFPSSLIVAGQSLHTFQVVNTIIYQSTIIFILFYFWIYKRTHW